MAVYYPAFLDLAGKKVVVVGGGVVAERKIMTLLACGAAVTLISPQLTARLERLAQQGTILVRRRSYAPGDMEGAYLAVVGSNDSAVNRQAAEEGRRVGALVNTVDNLAYCDFIAPAVVERGGFILAISTNGKSPAMARLVRQELQAYLRARPLKDE